MDLSEHLAVPMGTTRVFAINKGRNNLFTRPDRSVAGVDMGTTGEITLEPEFRLMTSLLVHEIEDQKALVEFLRAELVSAHKAAKP